MKIVVTMGGSDPKNIVSSILPALREIKAEIKIMVGEGFKRVMKLNVK